MCHYGCQVPYTAKIGNLYRLTTKQLDHSVQADQAEAVPRNGKGNLIALVREFLCNLDWAMAAAQTLGAEPDFRDAPPAIEWWFGKPV
jgi:hypothetical protein